MAYHPILLKIIRDFVLLAMLLSQGQTTAADNFDSPPAPRIDAIDANGKAILLPTPPEPLAKLIKSGNVRFEFYDAKVTTRSFAGETKFDFRYTYDCKSSWKLVVKDKRPAMEVRLQYHNIKLERTHLVSLPQDMIGDDLFDQRLTLHEFDHLKISCDERLPGLLERMLKQTNAVIVKTFDDEVGEFRGRPSSRDLSQISKQWVATASDKVFSDFVAIVSIRYRELDRISNNGLKPLSLDERQRIIDAPSKN